MEINLNRFINAIYEEEEQKTNKPLSHLTHLEDLPHIHGNEGVTHAADFLEAVHTHLSGKQKPSFTGQKPKTVVTEKFDGAPAIVFGRHPQTKKFFVATKSAFNKSPKINYTQKDIDANHGDKPALAEKLSSALKHLPKVAPQEGIYQGDLMHDEGSVEDKGGQYHFTPNTITYRVPKNSADGKKMATSKIGLVVHTKYKGTIGNIQPTPHVDNEGFGDHPDVHLINAKLEQNTEKYTPEHRQNYINHFENARQTYSKMKPEDLDHVNQHREHLDRYINYTVREDKEASFDDYVKHLGGRLDQDVSKYKTPDKREGVRSSYMNKIKHATENRKAFENHLELHKHLANAKDALIDSLDSTRKHWGYFVGNQQVGPEGYVAYHANKEDPVKLVRRKGERGFSRLNFAMGKMQAQKKGTIKEDTDWPNQWWKDYDEKKETRARKSFSLAKSARSRKFAKDLVPDEKMKRDIEKSRIITSRLNKESLIVARRMPNGKVRYGKPGQAHADLFNDKEGFDHRDEDLGFADKHGGRFMSRGEAKLTLSKKTQSKLNFKRLHSKDYNNAIKEEASPGVVFAYGRMNPPTTGHEVLVNKVRDLAKQHGLHHEVVLSHSNDPKKNPLTPKQKVEHAKKFFPGTNIVAGNKEHSSILHHASRLHMDGHDKLVVVAGSDRVPEFKKLLTKYNNVSGKHGYYNFSKIHVVSAGHRDPDAEGTTGMSASKMREHAQNNNFSEFRKGIPHHVSDVHARQLFNDVKKGMSGD